MKLADYYGDAPLDYGQFNITCPEMMTYLYLPVSMPGSHEVRRPERLAFCDPILEEVMAVLKADYDDTDHVYLTAKRQYVQPGYIGNRPGWHADGFGTDDLNFIWYDRDPTLFCVQKFYLSPCHKKSMEEMEEQVNARNVLTYPCRQLLKLDQSVIHATADPIDEGMRTFIKVSVSKHRYDMEGNSHNYLFDYDWQMYKRDHTRNTMSNQEYEESQ